MNISTAKVISEKREYPAGALRYVREGATNGEWSVYASSVNCERKPEIAELYIFGAEYFRIYRKILHGIFDPLVYFPSCI